MNAYEKYLWPAIFSILYMVFAVLVHIISFKSFGKTLRKLLIPIDKAGSLQDEVLDNLAKDAKTEILIKQFFISKSLKFYFRNLAVTYYQNYYVFSICSIVYNIILAIMILLVAGEGWVHTNDIVKALVMLTILLAAFYYFLPHVLKNEMNVQKNLEGVKKYQIIQFDILSFLSAIDTKTDDETNKFISDTYDSIKNNYSYNIDFDTALIDKNPLDSLKNFTHK